MSSSVPESVPLAAPGGELVAKPRFAWDWRRLLRRVLLLIPIGVLVNLAYSAWQTDLAELAQLVDLSPGYVLLALVLALLPWVANTLRVYNWLAFLGRGGGLGSAVRVTMYNELGAAVTPTVLGGGGVKAGMLAAQGLSVSEAVSVTGLGSIENAIFTLVAIPLGVWLTGLGGVPIFQRITAQLWPRTLQVAIVALGLLAILALVYLCVRRLRWVQALSRRWQGGWRSWVTLWRFVGRRGRGRLLANVLLAGVQYVARFSVISALVASLGLPVDPLRFALLQWFCFTATTLVPTPGGLGGAEASFLLVYEGLIPGAAMGVLMVAWRFLTFYLLNLGALFVLATWSLHRRAWRALAAAVMRPNETE